MLLAKATHIMGVQPAAGPKAVVRMTAIHEALCETTKDLQEAARVVSRGWGGQVGAGVCM
jgi:hypothetical protein